MYDRPSTLSVNQLADATRIGVELALDDRMTAATLVNPLSATSAAIYTATIGGIEPTTDGYTSTPVLDPGLA